MPDPTPLFHVVLVNPEIPNNTGNIGRTCVATGCTLHLVHPLGFDVSEKACRRAGLDYWPRLRVLEHPSWDACRPTLPTRRWAFSTKAPRSFFNADLRRGDALLFGCETRGLPDHILAQHQPTLVSLPMAQGERSLNLATAVCAAIYEGLRQALVRKEAALDPHGRLIGGNYGDYFTPS